MKRISILACILGVCFASTAWAQQPATKPLIGGRIQHRMADQTSRTPGVTASRSFNAQANPNDLWELGTYPGGTWFASWHINDLGMIVGVGDVPPIGPDGVGYTHTLAVALSGPDAGKWIDVGTLGGEQSKGWEEPFAEISNTGLVVSHSTAQTGHPHGVAWTKETGMVDLGTLADTGDSRYASYTTSYAIGTNKLGTVIVGGSGPDGDPMVGLLAPVVWTPSKDWMNGKFVTKWKIHKLDTAAFPDFRWVAWGVNDYGQIIGVGGNGNPATIETSALWNPRADEKSWEDLIPLPQSSDPDHPFTEPYGINESGEIAGIVASADWNTQVPALWQPLDREGRTYSLPIELPLPKGGFTGCECVGINDLGDLVGDCWGAMKDLPTRWTTKDLTFSEIIGFPGNVGFSWGVNNNRIASVTYRGGKNCPSNTYGSCGGAVQLQ
jgi:probable HAF family extracellular repeat protein